MIRNKLLLFSFAFLLSYISLSQDTTKYAIITFDRTEIDTGEVKEGPNLSFTYYFTNTGNADLIIIELRGGNGHMSPTWPNNPIAPGRSGKITITLGTVGRLGVFTKGMSVRSNAKNNPDLWLGLKGFIKMKE